MDDETVRKTCADECGAACCSGDIYVGESDAERLRDAGRSQFLDETAATRVMGTDDRDRCPFLNGDHTCSVYDNRPIDCRLFPLGMNVVEDRVEIVLVDCPLSELMTDAVTAELVERAKSIVSGYTPADLHAYDELSFSGEYTVVETVPIDELQLAEPAT